jgi:hypothetical protein
MMTKLGGLCRERKFARNASWRRKLAGGVTVKKDVRLRSWYGVFPFLVHGW